jgi:hypothetical protein
LINVLSPFSKFTTLRVALPVPKKTILAQERI